MKSARTTLQAVLNISRYRGQTENPAGLRVPGPLIQATGQRGELSIGSFLSRVFALLASLVICLYWYCPTLAVADLSDQNENLLPNSTLITTSIYASLRACKEGVSRSLLHPPHSLSERVLSRPARAGVRALKCWLD